jgi:hypothetical protein
MSKPQEALAGGKSNIPRFRLSCNIGIQQTEVFVHVPPASRRMRDTLRGEDVRACRNPRWRRRCTANTRGPWLATAQRCPTTRPPCPATAPTPGCAPAPSVLLPQPCPNFVTAHCCAAAFHAACTTLCTFPSRQVGRVRPAHCCQRLASSHRQPKQEEKNVSGILVQDCA